MQDEVHAQLVASTSLASANGAGAGAGTGDGEETQETYQQFDA